MFQVEVVDRSLGKVLSGQSAAPAKGPTRMTSAIHHDVLQVVKDHTFWADELANDLADAIMTLIEEPLRARNQPCGCIVCYCEENPENRCTGCGARSCGSEQCVFKVGGVVYVESAAPAPAKGVEAWVIWLTDLNRYGDGLYLHYPKLADDGRGVTVVPITLPSLDSVTFSGDEPKIHEEQKGTCADG